jgi:alkylation response protein AidB-like acyl-CoA dehydrogenase
MSVSPRSFGSKPSGVDKSRPHPSSTEAGTYFGAVDDVVGPDSAVGDWSLSVEAESVLADIAERAPITDRHGIERSQIDALAKVGLLGKPQTTPAFQREVVERLCMADASVWFSWAQHQTPMNLLATAATDEFAPFAHELQERWLAGLQDGTYLASVAFAHLRRPGKPNPIAERVHGGWEVTGKLDWVTSWDIADVMLMMVRGSGKYSDKVVCFYLAAGRDPVYLTGMHVHEPLDLLAMSGTHTRPIDLDAVMISDTNVAAIFDFDEWSKADAARSTDVNPASFGLIRGAVAELHAVGQIRSDEKIIALAEKLAQDARDLRRQSYEALDMGAALGERARLRARSVEFTLQAVTAVVVARAGAAMMSGCSAERRLREAMFMHVRAQTPETRSASMDLIGEISSSLA